MAQNSMRGFLLRLAPMVYGPTVLFGLGEGAILPLIPTLAAERGADIPTAALVASALVVGQLCGNLPASWLVARAGERVTMIVAGIAALLGVAGLVFAPNIGTLAASIFVIGLCAAAFGLARHAFMTTRVPASFRGRALSLLGGSFRLGMFIGPFVAALLLGLTGTPDAAAWCFAVCLVACVLLVWLGPDPETQLAEEERSQRSKLLTQAPDTGEAITGRISLPAESQPSMGIFRTMLKHRRMLSRLGLAAAALSAVRSARQVVLPIWGVSIGLDAQTIALVIGVSGAIDFALFYASGQVMDRFGRLWASLPALLLMGLGFAVLAFTHDGELATMWFAMMAAVIGVGNGMSSGILLTLGADVAPQGDPAPFLGSWRTLTDAGAAVSPLLFTAIAAATTLSIATGSIGLIAVFGAFGFARWVPRFVGKS